MKAFTAPSYPSFVSFQTKKSHFVNLFGLFVGLFIGLTTQTWAQFQKPDVSLPSPNAASLGLYGEVPVSLYTGTPNIEIPLYTLQEGNLKVPIGLSYHASGVRVNQHPGWVGLNWNLNTGGTITRVVRGALDEFRKSDTLSNYVFADGYLTKKNLLDDPNWDKKEYIQSKINSDTDLEPDEFSFNFLGYSGKFFLSEKGQWLVQCDEPIKVNILSGSLPIPDNMNIEKQWPGFPFRTGKPYAGSIKGFELITPNGTKYTFGGETSAIEYSIPFFDQLNGQWVANAWNLTKIESPEGNKITYSYEVQPEGHGKFIASFYYSMQNETSNGQLIYNDPGNNSLATLVRTVLAVPYLIHSVLGTTNDVTTSCQTSTSGVPLTGIFSGNLIRPTYLKSINGSTFKLDIELEDTQELVYSTLIIDKYIDNKGYDNLTFYNLFRSKNDFCPNCSDIDFKKKIFDQLQWKKIKWIKLFDKINITAPIQQFNPIYTNDDTKRLMLKGIEQINKDQALCKNNWNFDYYENGTTNLPTYLDPLDKTDHWGFFNANSYAIGNNNGIDQSYITHKESSTDITVLQEGSLRKITYPTGGYTDFTYESHSCYSYAEIAANGTNQLKRINNQKIGGIRIKTIKSFDGAKEFKKNYDYTYNGISSGILSGRHEYLYSINLNYSSGANVETAQKQIFSVQNVLPLSQNSLGNIVGYRTVRETREDGSYSIYNYTNFESNDGNHYDENIPSYSRTQPFNGRYEKRTDLSIERGRLLSEIHYNINAVKVLEKKYTFSRLSNEFARSVSASAERICDSYIPYNYGYAYKNYTFKYKPIKEESWAYEQNNQSKNFYKSTSYTYNSIGLPSITTETQNSKISATVNKYSSDYIFTDGCFEQYQTCRNNCSSGNRDAYGNCVDGCRSQYNACLSGKTYDEASKAIQMMKMNDMTGIPIEQQKWNNDNGTLGMVDGFINRYRSYPASTGYVNIQPEQTLQYAVLSPQTGVATSSIGINGTNNFYFKYDPNYKKTVVKFNDPANAYTLRGEPIQFTDVNNLTATLTYHSGAKTSLVATKTIGNQTTSYDYKPLIGLTEITDANNLKTKYDYDGFNRLVTVKDHWNNLLQSNSYSLATSSGCNTPKLVSESAVSYTLSQGSSCIGTGGINYERWNNISGNAVSNLTNNSRYTGPADVTAVLTSFEAPTDVADSYGARIRGYICAPKTGNYTFWIAGDDNTSLRLNKNGTDPAGATQIAFHNYATLPREWAKFSSQKSVLIALTAGQRYYIEALVKEGGGGDNLAVGWRIPGEDQNATPSQPIPGQYLIPFSAAPATNAWLSVRYKYNSANARLDVEAAGDPVTLMFERVDGQAMSGSNPDGAVLINSQYYPNGPLQNQAPFDKQWAWGKKSDGTEGIPANVQLRLTFKRINDGATLVYLFTPTNTTGETRLSLVPSVCPPPGLSATNNGQLCNGVPVSLSASGCTGMVTWSTGVTGNTLPVSTIGNYWASCTQDGCTSVGSNTMTITNCTSAACYTIKSQLTGKFIQAMSDGSLKQQNSTGQSNQLWKLEDVGNSQFRFMTQNGTGQVIKVSSGTSDGEQLSLGAYTGDDRQKWLLQQDGSTGSYRIHRSNGRTWDLNNYGSNPELQLYGTTSEPVYNYRLFQLVPSSGCDGGSPSASWLVGRYSYNGSVLTVQAAASSNTQLKFQRVDGTTFTTSNPDGVQVVSNTYYNPYIFPSPADAYSRQWQINLASGSVAPLRLTFRRESDGATLEFIFTPTNGAVQQPLSGTVTPAPVNPTAAYNLPTFETFNYQPITTNQSWPGFDNRHNPHSSTEAYWSGQVGEYAELDNGIITVRVHKKFGAAPTHVSLSGQPNLVNIHDLGTMNGYALYRGGLTTTKPNAQLAGQWATPEGGGQ